jgi:hypothetical protein
MNYTYKTLWDNAKLYTVWLIALAGAFTSQMASQISGTELVHLKVLN